MQLHATEVEVVTENKKPKCKTKGYKSEKMTPKKFNYILNVPIHIYESIGNTFPTRNVSVPLSDWWVGNILQSVLGGAERGKMWPCDFNSKGYIRASRAPRKGLQANRRQRSEVVLCGDLLSLSIAKRRV